MGEAIAPTAVAKADSDTEMVLEAVTAPPKEPEAAPMEFTEAAGNTYPQPE